MTRGSTYRAVQLLGSISSYESWALPCSNDYLSVGDAFARADIVIDGVIDTQTDSSYVVTVDELYKAPKDIQKTDKLYIPLPGIDAGMRLTLGAEYLIYGTLKIIDDKYIVKISPCSGTKPEPQNFIGLIKTWQKYSEASSEKLEQLEKLIFTGTVTEANHKRVIQEYSPNVERTPYTRSELIFDISEFINNAIPDLVLSDAAPLTVNARFCGEGYRVGHKYLVFAYATKIADPQADKPSDRKDVISLRCEPWGPMNLEEKQFLHKLNATIAREENDNDN